jgi:hypothetical protein
MRSIITTVKSFLWFFEKPLHPYLRDGLLALHLIHHHGRQQYHIGFLAPGKTAEALRDYLISHKGFEDHFPCWIDDGETVDLRFRQNFDWQFHLRIFEDGEVRGHHEYTPESRPIAHLRDRESTACTKEFMHFLGDWVVADARSAAMTAQYDVCDVCQRKVYLNGVVTA